MEKFEKFLACIGLGSVVVAFVVFLVSLSAFLWNALFMGFDWEPFDPLMNVLLVMILVASVCYVVSVVGMAVIEKKSKPYEA